MKLHGMALDFDGADFIRTNRPPSKVGAGVYGTTKHSEVASHLAQIDARCAMVCTCMDGHYSYIRIILHTCVYMHAYA